jgi:hypothetical protein
LRAPAGSLWPIPGWGAKARRRPRIAASSRRLRTAFLGARTI